MEILQFVGYKNSGKTTLLREFLEILTQRGYTVATLKHHGHDTPLEQVQQGDGESFFNKGALISTILSSHESRIYMNKTLTPEEIIAFYEKMGIHILLIEGFKELAYPKIVLAREGQAIPPVSNKILTLIGTNRTPEKILENFSFLPLQD